MTEHTTYPPLEDVTAPPSYDPDWRDFVVHHPVVCPDCKGAQVIECGPYDYVCVTCEGEGDIPPWEV